MSFESILSLCSFSHKDKSKPNIKSLPIIYGLFFSAHWCPQSESITSEIKNFYHSVNSSTPQFEFFSFQAISIKNLTRSQLNQCHGTPSLITPLKFPIWKTNLIFIPFHDL